MSASAERFHARHSSCWGHAVRSMAKDKSPACGPGKGRKKKRPTGAAKAASPTRAKAPAKQSRIDGGWAP